MRCAQCILYITITSAKLIVYLPDKEDNSIYVDLYILYIIIIIDLINMSI